jgi:hypothetical protein
MKFFMDEYEAGSDLAEYLTGRPGESKSGLVSAIAEREGIEVIEVRVAMGPKERAAWDALAQLDSQGFFFLDEMDPATPEQVALLDKLRWLPSGLPDTFGEEADSEPASA